MKTWFLFWHILPVHSRGYYKFQTEVGATTNRFYVEIVHKVTTKFLWSNILVIFVNYTEITKIFAMKISLQHP